jgi:translation initiation factor IF-2
LAKAKGIRVNQLAKELGIPSKTILDKIKAEGLGEQAPNHMSLISLGLAASVREWFADGSGGVAVAVEEATEAAAAEAEHEAPKAKAPRSRKKKEATAADGEQPAEPAIADAKAQPGEESADLSGTAIAEAPGPTAEAPQKAEGGPAPTIAAEAPAREIEMEQDVAPASSAETPTLRITGAEPAAPSAPAAHPDASPTTLRPAATAAPAAKPAAPAPPATAGRPGTGGIDPARPAMRPTVSLNDRLGQNRAGGTAGGAAARKPVPVVTPFVPKPATVQGPKIVRVEEPEVVSAPRRRPGLGQPGSSPPPAFTQARPQTGRGVKGTGDEEGGDEAKKVAKGGKSLSNRRRGLDGRRGEADANAKLREFTEADLIERRERLLDATRARQTFDSHLDKTMKRGTHKQAGPAPRGATVEVEAPISVKSLAAALGVKANDIIMKLMRKGVMANINLTLADDQAQLLATDYGVELAIAQQSTLEELLAQQVEAELALRKNLAPRPPVVTILGHVDHGKTSLLDKIRHANVAAGEAGGITQHTAAWMVTLGEGEEKKTVTFIDTPGHQAFTSMRARGAQVTDVVVLVVAAVEGVMPQTIESINHARAAGVPIVVALNKIDRPDANPDMVLGQLAKEGLNPVEWGGDTEVIRTSAVTGQGIEDLIEILHYQAELLELKADATARPVGTVIEARRDEGLGPVATVLVQDGTLKVGDIVLCGPGYGRIRALVNDRNEQIKEAGPSTPVLVSGLSDVPGAGDKFYRVDDMDQARAIAEERATLARQGQLATIRAVTLNNLYDQMKAESVKVINLIVKGDVQGSVETLAKTVTDHNTEEVKVRVIHSGVGPITESDVQLAMATKAKPQDNKVVIIGFHVAPDEAARALAEQNHIEIRLYQVIYEIFDDLKKALSGMLAPEVREKHHGRAEVRKVFKVSKIGSVAGCFVTEGHILRASKIRLIRGGAVVTEDLALESLKRLKDDVREVKAGFECGIKLAGYDDIKEGDVLDAYVREEFERTL